MRKNLVAAVLIVMLLGMLIFTGCSIANASEEPGFASVYLLTVQEYSDSEEGSNELANKLAGIAEEKSGGLLKIRIFPDGKLVDSFELHKGVRDGIIDAAFTNPGLWPVVSGDAAEWYNIKVFAGEDKEFIVSNDSWGRLPEGLKDIVESALEEMGF